MPEPIQQASAIPFRRRAGTIEFCMITSMSGRRWGFPKGIIEADDTAEETALIEAREEAGLHGRIVGDALGRFRYQKWGTDLDVAVFLMEVTKADETWQEVELRDREWVTAGEAKKRIERADVAAMFESALASIPKP